MSTSGIISTHKIRTRCICDDAVEVDFHIVVDGSLTVRQGHDIAKTVKWNILNLRVTGVEARAVEVIVHVEPADDERKYLEA